MIIILDLVLQVLKNGIIVQIIQKQKKNVIDTQPIQKIQD